MLDDEHAARCMRHDVARYAAEHQLGDARPPVRADDDQVGALALGDREQDCGRIANLGAPLRGEARLAQLALGVRLQLLELPSLIDARVALSSSCTADPFTADGTTCAPAAVNAAFDTFTSGCRLLRRVHIQQEISSHRARLQ